jgi:hypothetical protein
MQSPWPAIGNDLKNLYVDQAGEFFTHQAFPNDNFLHGLLPKLEHMEKFFGCHVGQIFIVQKAYGWRKVGDDFEFSWPPDPANFDTLVASYLQNRQRFASFTTWVWGDKWSAQMAKDEDPNNRWLELMAMTIPAVASFCSSTEGFEYMGDIEGPVSYAFFQEKIDEHFKLNSGGVAYRTY